jgi:hypothetical protein
MSRRPGQEGSREYIEGSRHKFRLWLDVPGQDERVHASIKICPVEAPGALNPSKRSARKRELLAEYTGKNKEVVESQDAVTFEEQGKIMLEGLRNRHREPVADSTYGLQTCQVAYATLYTEGSSGFVTSTAASIATGWSDPVPGWDLHPLLTSAFHGAHETGSRLLPPRWDSYPHWVMPAFAGGTLISTPQAIARGTSKIRICWSGSRQAIIASTTRLVSLGPRTGMEITPACSAG